MSFQALFTAVVSIIKGRTTLWVIALVGIGLSCGGLWIIRDELDAQQRLEVEWELHERSRALQSGIQSALMTIEQLADLVHVDASLKGDKFQGLSRAVVNRQPGIQRLMWVTDLRGDQGKTKVLTALNVQQGAAPLPLGNHGLGAWMTSPANHARGDVAASREDAKDSSRLGVGATTSRKEALDHALYSQTLSLSGRILFRQQPNFQYGVEAYMPVYQESAPTVAQAQHNKLLGVVVGFIHLDGLTNASGAFSDSKGVECVLADETAPARHRFLGFYPNRQGWHTDTAKLLQTMVNRTGQPHYTESFDVANRQWSMTCTTTEQFASATPFQRSPWVVLLAGLLLTTLIILFYIRNKQRLLERVGMEKALKEREELFSQMTETVDDAFWALDVDRENFLYVSPGYETLWGDSCEHLYKNPAAFTDGIHPDDRQRRVEALENIRRGEAVEVEYRVIQPDGGTRWIRDCGFPVRDADGEIFRMVGVAEDITERRLADQALRESEDKLRTLFNHSPDIIMTVDRAGRILMLNRSIPELTREEAVGRHSDVMLPLAFRRWYRRILEKVFNNGEIDHLRYSMPDATWWEVRIVPITEDDQVTAAIVIATDVTVNVILKGQTIRNARLASLGVLAAGVAHEINNPNNAIRFNGSLFRRVWQDAMPILTEYFEENGDFSLAGISFTEARDSFPRLLADITHNSDRIKRIVENLKHLVRQDTEELKEDVDVQEVLQEAAMILHNKIQKHTDAFMLDIGEGLPLVRGNSQQLEQVFINIILNALQALPERSAHVWVRSFLDEANNQLVVSVQDQGCGIEQEDLNRLTEPFFSTKTESGGTGLGLSITASIIHRHHGTMEFDSESGQGTTVIIRFPVGKIR